MYRTTNPMTLICPRCGAKPGQVCIVFEGEMEVVHVERIEAAAAQSHQSADVMSEAFRTSYLVKSR
jgi:hypothetical protein